MLLRYPTRLRPSIIAMSPFSPCPPFPLQERPHTQGWTTSRITHADSIFMGWGAPGGHDSSFHGFRFLAARSFAGCRGDQSDGASYQVCPSLGSFDHFLVCQDS